MLAALSADTYGTLESIGTSRLRVPDTRFSYYSRSSPVIVQL